MEIKIDLSNKDDIKKLRESIAGTALLLSGIIYSARDQAHKKIKNLLELDKKLDINLKDSIIYYMGPTPSREGYPIGSCGPTSSYRMDKYLEMSLKLGVIATIGKGERETAAIDIIKKYKAPYLVTIGGAGAYLASCVIKSEIIAFEELGAEAVRRIIVNNFPVIVGLDMYGKSIFKK